MATDRQNLKPLSSLTNQKKNYNYKNTLPVIQNAPKQCSLFALSLMPFKEKCAVLFFNLRKGTRLFWCDLESVWVLRRDDTGHKI